MTCFVKQNLNHTMTSLLDGETVSERWIDNYCMYIHLKCSLKRNRNHVKKFKRNLHLERVHAHVAKLTKIATYKALFGYSRN